jgi:hypothetical protein
MPAKSAPEIVLPAGTAWCPPAAAEKPPAPFTPFMLGDFVGPVANLFSDVKIAEGESPRPVDRVFTKTNYYNNLNKDRWTDPTEPIHNVELYRYVFGMEKTFFDQTVSLGVRIPFYTLDAQGKDFHLESDPNTGALVAVPGGPGFDTTQFGSVSAIAKAVLWEDRQTGNLISAGATLSFPTASSNKIDPGQSIIAYAQPFGGFILTSGDLFLQGFSSITLPLIHPESIVLFNDLGVGYYVYRASGASGWLTAVAPTFEIHIANPLRSPDPTVDIFGFKDGLELHNVVDLTFGSTFEFSNRSVLGVGFVIPVTGPKPFDFEGIAQFNYRF